MEREREIADHIRREGGGRERNRPPGITERWGGGGGGRGKGGGERRDIYMCTYRPPPQRGEGDDESERERERMGGEGGRRRGKMQEKSFPPSH